MAPLLAAIPYPQIDPVLVRLGPLAVRWYGLAYLAGFLLGTRCGGGSPNWSSR